MSLKEELYTYRWLKKKEVSLFNLLLQISIV